MSNGLTIPHLVRSLVARGCTPLVTPHPLIQRFYPRLLAALLSSSCVNQLCFTTPAIAQTQAYCQSSKQTIAEKENLLKASLKNNSAKKDYKIVVKQQADYLRQCRSQTWPNTQSIWLRLYPCDLSPGAMDRIMDRIVNMGYNQVNVEIVGNSQVLLPKSDNPTPWPSVVKESGYENGDLLAQAIQKAHDRGLKVYAWMYTMNFGKDYFKLPNRQSSLARNGNGDTAELYFPEHRGYQAFIDPYSLQAKTDYYRLVQAVTKRRPDGVLFDYVRYIHGLKGNSTVSNVKNLWIYGDASQQALYARALNNKGRDLIQRYLKSGYITTSDIEAVDKLYPQEASPLWEGRNSRPNEMQFPARSRQRLLQDQLWRLSIAHAFQGILDFLNVIILPTQKQQVKVGAVFFPEGNKAIGRLGYDSRLQAWDRFPSNIEWHPMTYGICGNNTSCIEKQIKRVLTWAPTGTQVTPALAGVWGQTKNNHLSLETQMQAIRRTTPQINSVSHFAFSWQDPQLENQRKFCRLQ